MSPQNLVPYHTELEESSLIGLESWLQNYSSSVAASNNHMPSLGSAYIRPTYTPLSSAPNPEIRLTRYSNYGTPSHSSSAIPEPPSVSSSLIRTSPRGQVFLDSYMPPTISSVSRVDVAVNVGECHSPTFSTLVSIPIPKPVPVTLAFHQPDNWICTEDLSLTNLDHIFSRLCSELNWDFFYSNFSGLNITIDLLTDHIWREILVPFYEEFVRQKGLGIDSSIFNHILKIFNGDHAEALENYKVVVHRTLCIFADVRVKMVMKGVHNPCSEWDKRTLREFKSVLLTGADIQQFPAARARAAGLTYPGGTGCLQERLWMAEISNRYERTIFGS